MNASMTNQPQGLDYELRFQSLFNEGRGYAFPCDAAGHVDMDSLSATRTGRRWTTSSSFSSPTRSRFLTIC